MIVCVAWKVVAAVIVMSSVAFSVFVVPMLPDVDVSEMSSPAVTAPLIVVAPTLVTVTSVPAINAAVASNAVAAVTVRLPTVAVMTPSVSMLAVVEVSVTSLAAVRLFETRIAPVARYVTSLPLFSVESCVIVPPLVTETLPVVVMAPWNVTLVVASSMVIEPTVIAAYSCVAASMTWRTPPPKMAPTASRSPSGPASSVRLCPLVLTDFANVMSLRADVPASRITLLVSTTSSP